MDHLIANATASVPLVGLKGYKIDFPKTFQPAYFLPN
jgi:hypothetical protein